MWIASLELAIVDLDSVDSTTFDNVMDTSFFIATSGTDKSTDDESHRPGSNTPSTEKKYLVFQSCLESLFHCCPVCHQHVTKTVMETTATLLTVQYTCAAGHHNRWYSQPRLRGTTAGNVLLPAAILFSGSNFTKFAHLADILNHSILAERTFHDIQSTYLFSVVHHTWTQH